jgi:hypothetical protein
MKRLRTHSPMMVSILASVSFILCTLLISAPILIDVQSQTGCPSLNPGSIPAWPKGVTVTVYIDPAYDSDGANAIKAAFTNWQNSTGPNGNNSGVASI